MNIRNELDFICLRFILALDQSELADQMGLEKSTIQRIESKVARPSTAQCLALLTVCYRAPHAPEIIELYRRLSKGEFVKFLYACSPSGRLLPKGGSTTKCCNNQLLNSYVSQGRNGGYDTLRTQCLSCGTDKRTTSQLQIRKFFFRACRSLKLWDESLYVPLIWRGIKTRYSVEVKPPAPRIKVLPIDSCNDLIAMRFSAGLSQEQLAKRLDVSVATVVRMETGKSHITKFWSCALTGLYLELAVEFPNFKRVFNSLDSDSAVQTWMGGTNVYDLLPRIKRPECRVCGAEKVVLQRLSVGNYAYKCTVCDYYYASRTNINLIRAFHLENDESIDLLDFRWWHTGRAKLKKR